MKIKPYSILLYFPLILSAQIPVTDVATNGSLGLVNSQLIQVNIQLKTLNQNILRLIQLMEKNNRETTQSKDILKEELLAKKRSPNYVLASSDVSMILQNKKQILKSYRSLRQVIQHYEYLTPKEKQAFLGFLVQVLNEATAYFTQGEQILSTTALIPAEERLKKINHINDELRRLLEKLDSEAKKLAQKNSYRQSKMSLIQLNKN